jgi:hypothetical protein
MADLLEHDPWPDDIKRSWLFTIKWWGLDGLLVTRSYLAHEKQRVSEPFLFGLIAGGVDHHGGLTLSASLVRKHFDFPDMPPSEGKIIACERADAPHPMATTAVD